MMKLCVKISVVLHNVVLYQLRTVALFSEKNLSIRVEFVLPVVGCLPMLFLVMFVRCEYSVVVSW